MKQHRKLSFSYRTGGCIKKGGCITHPAAKIVASCFGSLLGFKNHPAVTIVAIFCRDTEMVMKMVPMRTIRAMKATEKMSAMKGTKAMKAIRAAPAHDEERSKKKAKGLPNGIQLMPDAVIKRTDVISKTSYSRSTRRIVRMLKPRWWVKPHGKAYAL